VLSAGTGIAAVNVSYRTSPAALTDLIAGQVDFAFTETLTAMPLVRAGTLRALGVSQAQRVAGLADVPTFEEAGIPGLILTVWNAAYAPAATPPAVLDRLNALLGHALRRPETEAFFARDGFRPMPQGTAEFVRFQAAEHARWADIIRQANITLERLRIGNAETWHRCPPSRARQTNCPRALAQHHDVARRGEVVGADQRWVARIGAAERDAPAAVGPHLVDVGEEAVAVMRRCRARQQRRSTAVDRPGRKEERRSGMSSAGSERRKASTASGKLAARPAPNCIARSTASDARSKRVRLYSVTGCR
jgi:hypothetical protein